MSGFAGVVRINPGLASDEADRAAIKLMAGAIAFRGPDALQETHQPGASFAFSFLKTGPAPQEASQPCTLDGQTWLLGDVRCDGREEVIRKLVQHGANVSRSASSEQLVLHYYSKFGEGGLAELEGDLSFSLWNSREHKLIAFRDLTGARPFYYFHRDGELCFSNTMQAVLANPAVSGRNCDLRFMGDFLLGSPHHDAERTIYADVRRLPPGHLLEFSTQSASVRRIANLPVEDPLQLRDDQEYYEEFRRLMTLAVRDRLPSGDTTVLLSGGLDSTTIAAAAVKLKGHHSPGPPLNLRALSLDLQPLFQDQEGVYAERFAKTLGLPFELLHCAHILPFDGADSIAAHQPEPLPWPYPMLVPFCFSQIAKYSRVVLTGDGGDEMLRSQAAPYLRYLSSRLGLTRAAWAVLHYVLTRRKLPALGAGIRSSFFRILGYPNKKPEPGFPPWFTPESEARFGLRERYHALRAGAPPAHPFNPRSYANFNGSLVSTEMEKHDSTWTGFPIESRAPFFDRRLLRFLLRLPTIPWLMEKELLRGAQKGVLPDEIRKRPKASLPEDPLLLHLAAGKWFRQAPGTCPEPLRPFLDWQQLQYFLHNSPVTSLRLHLRPVILALWLIAVENREQIG